MMSKTFITFGKLILLLLCVAALTACGSAPTESDKPSTAVFFPDPPDPPRVQFLRSVSKGTDIEEARSGLDSLLFGEQEIEKTIMAPYGVCFHQGKAYVCDIQQSTVLTLDFKNREMGFLELTGRAVLQKPVNLAFAPDGRIFIADLGRRQVVVLGPDLQYQRELGPFSETSKVVDVEIKNDLLYLVDQGDALVRVFDLDSSQEIRNFGQVGATQKAPTNLVVDDDGTCYVVDTILCQVFVWSPEGEFVKNIGKAGDTVGEFGRPKGIGLDREKLFVVDAAFENCQILDFDGEPLMYFAGPGIEPHNMFLPAGVWIGEEGLDQFRDEIDDDFVAERLIIVANQFGPHKVNFYALGKSKNFDYE